MAVDRERRGVIIEQIRELRKELHEHILAEMPIIQKMQVMFQELGTPDQVRERRIFIELFITKELSRQKLRTALIEKGLLVAGIAVLVFIGQSVWHEVVAAIKVLIGVHK